NLPFRESYFPDAFGLLFVYALPLFSGYLSTRIVRPLARNNVLYYVNFSLFAGVLYLLPYIVFDSYLSAGWLIGSLALYNCMIFTCFFLIGSIPNWSRQELDGVELSKATAAASATIDTNLYKRDFIIAGILGASILLLNLIPFFYSHYLVGADVYYHAALTKSIVSGHSLFGNPFFLEERNYYYSVVYHLLALLSGFESANVEFVWFLVVPVSSLIFMFFFYLFAKRLLGSGSAAFFAALFIGTLNQILWTDPSIRNVSYAFMMVFFFAFQSYLLDKTRKKLAVAGAFFLLTIVSHPEIALHVIGIMCAYYLISKFLPKLTSLTRHKIRENADHGWMNATFLENRNALPVLVGLFLLFSGSNILSTVENYPITQILVFNEWPLSVWNPIGISSFVVFMFIPMGFMYVIRNKSPQNLFLLSISALLLTSVFLFSHIWIIYHRYFTETAYIGLSIVAMFAIKDVMRSYGFREKAYFQAVLLTFVIISLMPKLYFIYVSAKNTDVNLTAMSEDLRLIKDNTPADAVILFNPRDSLSRYVPFYAERYIVQGTDKITKEQQWQVLSFCNGPFSTTCSMRYALANRFFNDPSENNLKTIQAMYQADYLLLNRGTGEDLTVGREGLNIEEIARDSSYVLYIINS
ncbi:MAG: hypothetical protein QOG91_263, partial [Candidatus Parcubacteria bacterium]|nr:hypothetical protein [Candidatus Parcubacteria bacterium]